MGCHQLTRVSSRHLVACSTTMVYEWFTGWLPAVGVDAVRPLAKVRATDSAFQWQFALQTAAVRTDHPSNPVLKDALQTGAGERCPGDIPVATDTQSVAFVRLGLGYKASSGTAQADVSAQFAWAACGRMIAAETVQLATTSTGSDVQAVEVSEWIPAFQVDKVKAALVIASLSGNLQCRLCIRTAVTSPEQPGAWTSIGDPWHGSAAELNTGELPVSLGSVMWVQVGLQYQNSSGTALGQATVTSFVGVRKA